MITTIQPRYLIVSETCLKYRYQFNNRYFVVDDGFNKMEITETDYKRLKCPVRTPKKEREE